MPDSVSTRATNVSFYGDTVLGRELVLAGIERAGPNGKL